MIDKENLIKYLDGKYYIGVKELIESIQSGKYDVKLNKDQSASNQYCHTDISDKFHHYDTDHKEIKNIIVCLESKIEEIEQKFIKIEEKTEKIEKIIHDLSAFISEIYFNLFVSEKNIESKK